MQVNCANDVKVYNLSAGKSLPEWISDRKKRTLLKNDIGIDFFQHQFLVADLQLIVSTLPTFHNVVAECILDKHHSSLK